MAMVRVALALVLAVVFGYTAVFRISEGFWPLNYMNKQQKVSCFGADGPITFIEPEDHKGTLQIDEFGVYAKGFVRYWPNYGTICSVSEFKTEEELLREHLKKIEEQLKNQQTPEGRHPGNGAGPQRLPNAPVVEPKEGDLDA